MAYRLSKRFTPKERSKVLRIIKDGLEKDKKSGVIIKDLRSKGLGYQDSKMYHDIRRKDSSFQAKTPESRSKALRWHDKVYEPFRKKHAMSSKSATRTWERARQKSYETVEQAELGTEFWDLYKGE